MTTLGDDYLAVSNVVILVFRSGSPNLELGGRFTEVGSWRSIELLVSEWMSLNGSATRRSCEINTKIKTIREEYRLRKETRQICSSSIWDTLLEGEGRDGVLKLKYDDGSHKGHQRRHGPIHPRPEFRSSWGMCQVSGNNQIELR